MAFDRYATISIGGEGSVFLDTAATAFSPAAPLKVVAITMITDCKFSALSAQSDKFIGILGANPDGDTIDATDVFPAGITIYGEWSTVSVSTNGEQCICYLG
tara:strand:+ start:1139 stop:1444 length:306 start_codon:yes stop_codon:yes gene_type:complete